MDNNIFTDKSEVQTLFGLVPPLLLLFWSWYYKNMVLLLLLDFENEKSEKELLQEMTRNQKLKLGKILQEERLGRQILEEILRHTQTKSQVRRRKARKRVAT